LRQDHPHLKFIITEDSLSSNGPHIETLQAHNLHYILGVKEGDHTLLFQQVEAADHAWYVTSMSATTALRVSCIAFGLSMICRSMPRMRTCASISSSTGRWARTRSNTSVG
jgi:hypothetical protein